MDEKLYTVSELEKMLREMKPECESCRIMKDIRTPAFLKEDPREAMTAMYFGLDAEIDPIRSLIKYCPACGRKLDP